MATLPSFETTTNWQELTGVSQTSGVYNLQNTGSYTFLLYRGETPNETDARRVSKIGINNDSIIEVNPDMDKVWVKSSFPTRISINQFTGLSAKPYNLSVSQGGFSGSTPVDKFGENSDIDSGSAPEDIWEVGGLYNYDANNTAPIVSLISDDTDDTEVIRVIGLDINGEEVTQDITLNGTSRVALTTPLWRVYRMSNVGSNDLQGTVYCYVGTGGVPSDANTRAIINGDNNQTLMALYTIPLGKVGFLVRGEAGMTRNQSNGTANISYRSRRYNKVFTVKKDFDINNQGSNIYQDVRSFPDVIPALTDIKITANSVSGNNTGIFATFDILLEDEDKFSAEYLAEIGQPSST